MKLISKINNFIDHDSLSPDTIPIHESYKAYGLSPKPEIRLLLVRISDLQCEVGVKLFPVCGTITSSQLILTRLNEQWQCRCTCIANDNTYNAGQFVIYKLFNLD